MNGLPASAPIAGGRPLIVSHSRSKKPQKRRRAFRTSTAISCPSPVRDLQREAAAMALAAKPIAAIAPNRKLLGIIGSRPKKERLPPQSAVTIPTSLSTCSTPPYRSKSEELSGLLSLD